MAAYSEERSSEDDALPSASEPCVPSPCVNEAHAERIAQLFNQYHGKLVKALAVQTRSREEARDIAAQAFEAILVHESPGSVQSFGAYLYQTARNLATNQLKRQAMQRRKVALVHYHSIGPGSSPEPACAEAERHGVLRKAIDSLPADLRMALVLRIYEDLSDVEIAARFEELGAPITDRTVRRYIGRAYEHIRGELEAAENPRQESQL